MNRPACVIVTGRPGAGKTTLARQLADRVRMPLLSRDQIKEGYVNTFGRSHEELPADANRKVTDAFFLTVQNLLKANVSLIVEAAFQHKLWTEAVAAWSGAGTLRFVICNAQPELCARRHLERGLNDPAREFYHGDSRVKTFRQTGEVLPPGLYEPPSFDLPTLIVSTTDGHQPEMDKIAAFAIRR